MRGSSIIDLKTGGQPIFNEDKDIVIVFNGEIYNFLDLKKELVAEGQTDIFLQFGYRSNRPCLREIRRRLPEAFERHVRFGASDKKPTDGVAWQGIASAKSRSNIILTERSSFSLRS